MGRQAYPLLCIPSLLRQNRHSWTDTCAVVLRQPDGAGWRFCIRNEEAEPFFGTHIVLDCRPRRTAGVEMGPLALPQRRVLWQNMVGNRNLTVRRYRK
jgi:hypothetical protein